MARNVHIFGIRHHGPGSARQLVNALNELQPTTILIEGPADASALLPTLGDPDLVPPIALLAYATDDPTRALFWPFACFSPEYQAARWAIRNNASLRFIDLPASWLLAEPKDQTPPEETGADPAAGPGLSEIARLERDPVGILAAAAGYGDGESWWRDVIEENPAPGPVFAAVAGAMAALRAEIPTPAGHEAAREAHMRIEIAGAVKETSGAIAVVCGAWHAPALQTQGSISADRALLKGAPKRKISATWAPWTAPRLATRSGYGAGVAAPGWCAHLWTTPPAEVATRWLARIAMALREHGQSVSTASLIEAQRLAVALAAIRRHPAVGFEELRDAAVACLCFGEPLLWSTIETDLLIGAEVGRIPANVPFLPLLEDLQREQKRLRLVPEALDRELGLDLRTGAGLDRSSLLHRLAILDVPWGRLADAGRSRGTFRERWVLRWEPEFTTRLVENLVFGATIAQAASGRMDSELGKATDLKALADLVIASLTALLPNAVARGTALIEQRAAQCSDCIELLTSLPPLANITRYGEARATDAAQLRALVLRILVQATLALPYAARALDSSAAAAIRVAILSANEAVALAEIGGEELASWRRALVDLMEDQKATPLLAGLAARLSYEAEQITSEATAEVLARMLSPGQTVADAAGFFDGFFDGGGARLIYDKALRTSVDRWLGSLDQEHFTEFLPLFRRAFANLDRMQRKRLLDALFGRAAASLPGQALARDAAALWPEHFARLACLLTTRPADE